MPDALRVTIAAILLLIAIGIIGQVGNFLSFILNAPEIAKWTNILIVAFTAVVISWWIYMVG